MKQLLGLIDRLRFLIMVLILCLCTSVRTYKVVNFKWVQVIEQKSYLNKVLKMRSSFTPYLENYHRFTLSLIIINQFCIYTRTQYCSDYTLRRNLIADIHDMCQMFKIQRAILDTVDIFSNMLENVYFPRKMRAVTDLLEVSLIDLRGRLLYPFSITAQPITTNLAT